MKKNKEEIDLITSWLQVANENLLIAKSIIKEDYAPYRGVCYNCQQSAEKFLKAFLIYNGWKLRKTHDLLELLDFCNEFEISFTSLSKDCDYLNSFSVEGRYPGDLAFEYFEISEAQEAINSAEKIKAFVESLIDIKS